MENYYNEYYARRAAPSMEDDEQENNTHYMASNMIHQSSRGNRGGFERDRAAASAHASGYGGDAAAHTNAKIYVTNMPPGTDENKLTQIFGPFGEIIAITHKGTYAFVEFTEPNAATDTIAEMKASGSPIKVQLAFTRGSAAGAASGGGKAGGFIGIFFNPDPIALQ